jgi:hypothetical protein
MTRIGADFTFLRRSFLADTSDGTVADGCRRIRLAAVAAGERCDGEVTLDRQRLVTAVPALDGRAATTTTAFDAEPTAHR